MQKEQTMHERVLIVGAGTAGCIAAARLSEDTEREVILLEAGPDLSASSELRSVNWMDALNFREAFYPDLFATKISGSTPKLYQRGRGIGGSASTNAMLALPGLPADYTEMAEKFGLTRWGWDEVQPWFAKLKPDLTRSLESERTHVDRALLRSGRELGLPDEVDAYTPENGSALLYRTADQAGRKSSAELWLDPARARENLTITPNAQVNRLLLEDGVAVGVVLVNGEEIRANQVILAAGVFETPCILMRSGVGLSGIGKGLQDHPAASVYFSLRPEYREADRGIPCIGSVLRCSSSVGEGDIHLLPLHGTLIDSQPAAHGLLMAALMRVRSVGSLRLNPDNPLAPPIVDEAMLSHPDDRRAMRDAIIAVEKVLAGPAFAEIVEEVFIDERGTPLSALDDDDTFDVWLEQYVGDYFHAVGTARMGQRDDPEAVVDERGNVHGLSGVAIWDASVFPEVPSANTHLPVAMLAERLSAAYRTGTLI